MAKDDLKQFQAALTHDAQLRMQAQAMFQQGQSGQTETQMDWAPVAELAAEQGYSVTVEELQGAFVNGDRELRDQELEISAAIDGGAGNDEFMRPLPRGRAGLGIRPATKE